MAESLEGFVDKLRSDGVEAGRRAAAEIVEQAERKAHEKLEAARAEAARIVEEARAEARRAHEREEKQLRLAARDIVGALRTVLTRTVVEVCRGPVKHTLQTPDFLAQLIHDIALEYAKADSRGVRTLELHVSEEMRTQLTEWALDRLRSKESPPPLPIQFEGTTHHPGLEYTLGEGTVEITLDSVIDAMAALIGPRVRELMKQASTKDKED